jgi:hypothetical protein
LINEAIFGSAVGVVYAEIYGLHKLSTSFKVGSNWFLVSAPFFGIRQSILAGTAASLEPQERVYGRDGRELIASTTAGTITGAAIGHVWSLASLIQEAG